MAKVTAEPKTVAQSDTPDTDTPTTPTTSPTETEKPVVVPDNIAPLFKACPQYDQLWIDREGAYSPANPWTQPRLFFTKTYRPEGIRIFNE